MIHNANVQKRTFLPTRVRRESLPSTWYIFKNIRRKFGCNLALYSSNSEYHGVENGKEESGEIPLRWTFLDTTRWPIVYHLLKFPPTSRDGVSFRVGLTAQSIAENESRRPCAERSLCLVGICYGTAGG